MSLPGNPIGTKEEVYTAKFFWRWFKKNHKRFEALDGDLAEDTPDHLTELAEELKKYDPWFKGLIGKSEDGVNELIITSDGDIALFLKVERFVSEAPAIQGWSFIAHKPPLGFEEISIEMHGQIFSEETVKFYPLVDPSYPDKVSIAFTHINYSEAEAADYQTAGSIYVQNAMGELNTAIQLDHYEIRGEPEDSSELIPVTKLNDYLNWRQKEFVEKYDHVTMELPEELIHVIEGHDEEGNVMMAMVVSSFEAWDYKPAYCWWVRIEMEYAPTEKGLPGKENLIALQAAEDNAIKVLTADKGIIYTASKTFRGFRTVYFYAKNFRDPAALLYDYCESANPDLKAVFFIEKDKYWQNMEEFFGLDEEIPEDEEEMP